jgi:pimeloyl-ACP methyl ester carboxylesterase
MSVANKNTVVSVPDIANDRGTTMLRLSDTLQIRYQKTGTGPALVLMHTIRTQLEYFRSVAAQLSRSFTVYAIDLPGHGYSSIERDASFEEPYFRKAVIDFIERLDLKDVTLVGESIGGALALTVAAEVPEKIARVVSINPYDYETRFGDGIRRGNWFANFIIGSLQMPIIGPFNASMENKMVLGKIMAGGYHDPRALGDDLLTEFDKAAHRPGYKRGAIKVLAGWRSWAAARSRYSAIKAPVTLVYGDEDWSNAAERKRTRSLIPDVTSVSVANAGHFSSVEKPAEIAKIVLGHAR